MAGFDQRSWGESFTDGDAGGDMVEARGDLFVWAARRSAVVQTKLSVSQ
uniref:Uncharacterized protein n=1 Tax=viral metagenome TaxID=1070528 RepID=A0A6H1ZEM8_9ZZZZ